MIGLLIFEKWKILYHNGSDGCKSLTMTTGVMMIDDVDNSEDDDKGDND